MAPTGAETAVEPRPGSTNARLPTPTSILVDDPDETERVLERNNGVKKIPVIVFADDSHLVEPTNAELEAKMQALADADSAEASAPAVVENTTLQRFELLRNGDVVSHADYRIDGDRLVVPHVETAAAHRGNGYAAELMDGMLALLRSSNRTIVPLCPFAAQHIRDNEQYHDLSVWDDPIDGPDAGNSVCTDRAVPCPPVLAAVPGKERGDGKILQRNPFVAHDVHVEQHGIAGPKLDRQPVGDHDHRAARGTHSSDRLLWFAVVVKDRERDRRPTVGECGEREAAGRRVLQSAKRFDLATKHGGLIGLRCLDPGSRVVEVRGWQVLAEAGLDQPIPFASRFRSAGQLRMATSSVTGMAWAPKDVTHRTMRGMRRAKTSRSAVVTTAEMYLSLELAAEHVRDTGRALRDQQCVDDVGAVVVVDVARIGVDAHGVVAQRAGAAVLADAGTELCDHEGVGDVDGDAAIHVARELGANQAADGVAGQLRRRLGEALLDGECERCGVEHVAGRDVYGQQLGGCGPTRRGHGLEDDQTRCGLGAGHPCCAGRARGEFDQGWIEADRGTYGRSGGRARAKKSAIAARANTVMLVLIRPMSVVPNALGEQECVGQVDVAVVVEVGGDVCPRW
ncbi:hypothetical protein GQR58_030091 [Nymphon striatum]|nr:hypothetical protein GQR58_030091 [Nymphon striatum]